jgi:phosphopantetheinyl transferase
MANAIEPPIAVRTVWLSSLIAGAPHEQRRLALQAQWSASSQRRWLAFRDAGRQTEFLHTRGLLLHALRRSGLNIAPAQLNDEGPAPRVPGDWFVSVSHSRGLHAVVCDRAPLGVDLERRERRLEVERLAPRLLTAAEAGWVLGAADQPTQQLRFLRIWTAREAAFKAGQIALVSAGPSWIVDNRWSPPFFCRQRLSVDYVLSVVTSQACERLKIVRVKAAI